jgi:hypothetical protein
MNFTAYAGANLTFTFVITYPRLISVVEFLMPAQMLSYSSFVIDGDFKL